MGLVLSACNNTAPRNTQNTTTSATSQPTDKFTVGLVLVWPRNEGWGLGKNEFYLWI